MLSNCLKYRKNTENKNPQVVKSKNGRIILVSKFAVCDSKKLKFIKEQEASGLLSCLGIKTPLSKIPLVGPHSLDLHIVLADHLQKINKEYKN